MRIHRTMRTVIVSLASVLLLSCEKHPVVYLPSGLEYVFDKNGRVTDYSINLDNPRVIQYQSLNMLHDDLYHTPSGKLNSIFEANPQWEFVYYCHCELSDSTDIVETLKRYDTNHRVIIDTAAEFLTINNLSSEWTELGYICNSKGQCYGIGIAGSSLSSFDTYFRNAKLKMSH